MRLEGWKMCDEPTDRPCGDPQCEDLRGYRRSCKVRLARRAARVLSTLGAYAYELADRLDSVGG